MTVHGPATVSSHIHDRYSSRFGFSIDVRYWDSSGVSCNLCYGALKTAPVLADVTSAEYLLR